METVFKLKKEIDKGLILPVVEMFHVGSSTVQTTAKLLNSDTPFILILNPRKKRKDPVDHLSVGQIIQSLKNHDPEKIIYGIYIDNGSIDEYSDLMDQLNHKSFALFHTTTKNIDINKVLQITQKHNLGYNFFLNDTISSAYHQQFTSHGVKKIIMEDPFHKQKANSEYKKKEEEPFYNLHVRYQQLGFDGFGDYLTLGSIPSDAGGNSPNTVVIHYTYPKNGNKEDIWIKRFFGDINKEYEKSPDGALKAMREAHNFIESNIRDTCSICNDCKDLISRAKRGNPYGLGKLKQFSMMHHVNMIIKLIDTGI